MAGHPGSAYGRLFPQRSIPDILILILQVGKKLRKKSETDREDWLTTRLHRSLIREPAFRDGPLQIDLQPDIVNSDADAEINTPEGRLDLKISCNRGYEVYFAIEAKRLRVSLPSRFFLGGREYVKEGMMRFVTGQYSPSMQTGAMLGYVYDGNKNDAREEIDRQILNQAKELKVTTPQGLRPSTILPLQTIDETKHFLEKRPFTIYHILLGV